MYQEEYKRWLAADLQDADLNPELSKIEGNDEEIKDRFAVALKFGTAGLRGVLGAGTNRMNIYTIAKVNSPFTAVFPSTVAIASPIPTGPFFFIIFTSNFSLSPGTTCFLNFNLSIPPNSAFFPLFSSIESIATAPDCANASTINTPGIIWFPGKCPLK